jgi:hypothetical protein
LTTEEQKRDFEEEKSEVPFLLIDHAVGTQHAAPAFFGDFLALYVWHPQRSSKT